MENLHIRPDSRSTSVQNLCPTFNGQFDPFDVSNDIPLDQHGTIQRNECEHPNDQLTTPNTLPYNSNYILTELGTSSLVHSTSSNVFNTNYQCYFPAYANIGDLLSQNVTGAAFTHVPHPSLPYITQNMYHPSVAHIITSTPITYIPNNSTMPVNNVISQSTINSTQPFNLNIAGENVISLDQSSQSQPKSVNLSAGVNVDTNIEINKCPIGECPMPEKDIKCTWICNACYEFWRRNRENPLEKCTKDGGQCELQYDPKLKFQNWCKECRFWAIEKVAKPNYTKLEELEGRRADRPRDQQKNGQKRRREQEDLAPKRRRTSKGQKKISLPMEIPAFQILRERLDKDREFYGHTLLPMECWSLAYFKFGTDIVLFSQDLQNPDVLVDTLLDIERRCNNCDDIFNLDYDYLETFLTYYFGYDELFCPSIYSGLYGKRTKVGWEPKKFANVEEIFNSMMRCSQHMKDYASFILMNLNLESAQARKRLFLKMHQCMTFMMVFNSATHNKGFALPNGAYVPFDNNESDIDQRKFNSIRNIFKRCLKVLQKCITIIKSLGLTEKGYALLKLYYFLSVNTDRVNNTNDRKRILECRRKVDAILYSRLTTYLDVTDSNIDISHEERFRQLKNGLKDLRIYLWLFTDEYCNAMEKLCQCVDVEPFMNTIERNSRLRRLLYPDDME